MKVPRKSHRWTDEEDKLLIDAVNQVGTTNWIKVSKCKYYERN